MQRARMLQVCYSQRWVIPCLSCRAPHQMVLADALCRAWETGG
jgi:hypothetical protein